MLWKLTGALAAILTMFSFVPQIIKVLKNRSAKDVSLIMILQLSLGVFLWIVYGFYLRDPIIITANSVTLTSLFVLLLLYFNYGRAH